MTLHKLTAGDGYTYLTRQVAAQDVTARGRSALSAYYDQKGESPGVWMGRGLTAVPEFPTGEQVTEAQMTALFGEGRHPNADQIYAAAIAEGRTPAQADAATRLGKPYLIHEDANEFRARCATAFSEHNGDAGLPRDWPVPAADRATIRTAIARDMFAETFGRQPADARELSGHLARISRQATTAVAGYDLTFSPVKSVSTLWAIAPRQIAQIIEQAHHDAVADTLTWLEDHATYTRVGAGGVAQVDVHGLIAAAFTHRDSRAGDPDLHTHIAISNKVQTLDGRWYALDGRPIYKNNVPASERYNTRLEALLTERLGVTFADRDGDDPDKRPVREIVGIDGDLPRAWSSRRVAINTRRGELSAKFQADHGRPPTAKEAVALAQQANLETRQHKHGPRSYAEQRAAWRADAITVLGGEARLHYFVRDALRGGRPLGFAARHRPRPARVSRAWIEKTADEVLRGRVLPDGRRVGGVQSERATWQANHVRAEAERRTRSAGVRYADLDRAVDAVVAAALSPTRSILLDERDPITAAGADPAPLRRIDGSSVFTVAGAARYTSAEILAAEAAILAAASHRDARAVPANVLDLTLLEHTANGHTLNPGQVQLVRELATSRASVQLALAPAGTGKTTAMRVLAAAWQASGGRVIGFAPSAGAAGVLREEIGTTTDTLAKLSYEITERPARRLSTDRCWLDVPFADKDAAKRAGARWDPDAKAWYAPAGPAQVRDGAALARWRDWVTAIGPDTLVIIDEAGMAGTPDLAAAIDYITHRGGAVRLIGDNQQLAAIGAGGVLRDIAHEYGAVTLSQVMRFTHPDSGAPNRAEGAASLALRDGDPAALGYHLDHGRIHVGDLSTVTTDAYTAWSADLAAGRDPIMLAPTRELVAELNDRARTDRLLTSDQPVGPEVQLRDGTRAGVGDTIITRDNDRRLRLSGTDYVKNGDRWQVCAVHATGALTVTRTRSNRGVTLPAEYVRTHVELGYAATVHSAQGITADTCHTVATGEESRQLLYVAMTRGQHANHVYLTTAGDGDPHSIITRDALLPPTAGDILTRILGRDESSTSATTQRRELARADLLLQAAAARYRHALHTAAEDHLGADQLARIEAAAEATVPHITHADAWPTLRGHLALIAVTGYDPVQALTDAAGQRELDTALDVAAVLDWRLDPTGKHSAPPGPLPLLPGIPAPLLTHPEWGDYLTDRSSYVADLAETVAAHARAWTPTSAPAWATPFIDADPDLVADLAVWRAAHGVDDSDRRPTGPPQPVAADTRTQRRLDQRVTRVLRDPAAATRRWKPLAASIDPRLTDDPYWPTLAERLTAAERAGINISQLARAAGDAAPLPDEQPAAALWWRIAGHLSPAAMTATEYSAAQTLRPAWTPALSHTVGDAAADRIMADPAWPTLVAAVHHAEHADWQPDAILSVAYELLHGGHPDDEPFQPGELTTALAWRIGLLTDHATGSGNHGRADATAPASHTGPGTDRHGSTAHAGQGSVDDDWLASLLADEPDPYDEANRDLDPDIRLESVAERSTCVTEGDAVIADIIAQLERADQQRHDAAAQEAHFWATAAVPRDRLVELNALAEQFFTRHYTDAWAADYLRERLGTDLANDPRFTVGYAPNNWTALTRHLRRHGATDLEILAAGLGVRTALGRVIDRFRDRIVFPIKASDPDDPTVTETRGFIARRNPARTDDDRAGPKYLNTADTDLFRKGRELYGLVDNAAALAAGAAAVLVEGPMDAIAVTLSGAGAYVGIAPLGTAFTDSQADALRPYISTGTDAKSPRLAPIIVATDTDRAGQHAAHRAFWQLAARGEDPHRLLIPHGKDPAELLQADGLVALRAQLDSATPLAEQIIADRTRSYIDRLDTIEGRVYATRRAAEVIGALPPQTWPAHATTLAERFGMASATVINEILDAGHAWSLDPRGRAGHRLAERIPEPAPTISDDPSRNWVALVAELTGRDVNHLATDAHWPTLAAHLTRAADTGYDVANRLRILTVHHPITDQHVARTLDLRLIADCPRFLPHVDLVRTRDESAAAEQAAASKWTGGDRKAAHDQLRTTRPGATAADAATPRLDSAPKLTPQVPKRQPGRPRH